jgi:ABC-2 type transport system ATP-binding protein
MIEVNNVSKNFSGLEALNKVTLRVQKGSIYGLVGSNGAGKTTLMKILAGIYRPDQGEVVIDSEPVLENINIKGRMVFIPDHLYFFNNYTVEDMAAFYRSIYPNWSQDRFNQLATIFNIDVKRRVKTLSKGMQRQVAFWLGFALRPEVMILDEPLDGLDPVMRQKVKNLMVSDVAERELSIIISSHNLRELEDICDYIGILHQGNILIQRELDDLKADVHKIQIAFAGEVPARLYEDLQPLFRETRGSVHILILRGSRDDILKRINAYHPAILDVLPLTLEEIFIYEMGDNGYAIQNIIY